MKNPTEKVFQYTKEKAIEVWEEKRNQENGDYIDDKLAIVMSVKRESDYFIIINLFDNDNRKKLREKLKDFPEAQEYFDNYILEELKYMINTINEINLI